MPEATGLHTPPLTAPTSPTSPTTTALRGDDSIIEFGHDEDHDPEKCNSIDHEWSREDRKWDDQAVVPHMGQRTMIDGPLDSRID